MSRLALYDGYVKILSMDTNQVPQDASMISSGMGEQNFSRQQPGYTVGGSQGDIILTPNIPNSSKSKVKITVIALIAFMLAAIIGLSIWLVISRNTSPDNPQNNLAEKFNSYANQLLYGKDSDEKIAEFQGVPYIYYFDNQTINIEEDDDRQQQDNTESIVDYYSGLATKLSDFSDAVEESTLSDEIKSEISQYVDDAFAYFESRQVYFLDGDTTRAYYAQNGYAKTKNLITEQYSKLVNSEYQKAADMGELLTSLATYQMEEFRAYQSAGCVNGIGINFDCSDILVDSDVEIIEAEFAVETVVDNLRAEVLKGCWSIYEKLI